MNNSTLDFIIKMLKDTLKLDIHYILSPYNNISIFDRFLRESLENSESLYEQVLEFITTLDHQSFHHLTDSYQLNYILFYPYQDKQDVISIGPYFNNEITDAYWNDVMNQHKLTLTNIQHLKGFLHSIPVISNNLQLISITNNILSYINPDAEPYSIKYHDLTTQEHSNTLYQPKNNFEAYFHQVSERYRLEQELLSYISNGNQEGALEIAEKFVSRPIEPRMKNTLRDQKSLLITANTLFRKVIEPNDIHPIYLHEISSKFVNLIENATNSTSLDKLYEKMIRDYCHLVKNKSTIQYSPIVRQTIHYIEFNLNSKFNLNDLAKNLGVSVPYLASQFKKEVNVTIITYMNQLRINTAIKLLNTSTLSIQDIALHVGIYDNNYFTKVFKKQINITPTEYRRQLYDNKKNITVPKVVADK